LKAACVRAEMLEAATHGGFGAAARRAGGVRRAKALARVLLLLASCTLLTACPPDGGDLQPLAREGASTATTSSDGDTLVVTREGVTLRARGRWSVADAATSVILDVSNANAEPAAIDFGRGELSRDGSGGGRMTLRSVSRESGAGGATAFLPDKRAELGGGDAAMFVLEYKVDSEDGRSGVPRDVTGQTATLRLPVACKGRTTADFVFAFKYAERRTR
jgi:hypothetical protein